MRSVLVFCLLLSSACVIAGEQESTPEHEKTKSASAPAPANAQPAAEMSKLYPRIGRWQAIIRTVPGPSLPKGGIDKGVMTIKKGPGGFSIVQDFWSRGTSGPVTGVSYTWWDSNTKAYKSVWCDNVQGCTDFTTAINGNSWTVEFDGEADGKKVHTTIRATMSEDHNWIHEETSNSYDGGPAQTETVSDYKRIIPGKH